MTSQRSWVLLVLRIGIAIGPKIVAGSYDDDVDHSLQDEDSQICGTDMNDCINVYKSMMKLVTKDLKSNYPIEASQIMGNITEDFLSCISMLQTNSEQNHDSNNNQAVLDPDDESYEFIREYTPNALAAAVYEQIQYFHLQPNFERVKKRLIENLHQLIRDFANAILYREVQPTNHGVLVRQMLHNMCETILGKRLAKTVEIMIDKQLEPYITKEILIREFSSRKRSKGQLAGSRITGLLSTLENIANPKPYDYPDCVFDKLEPMIDCTLNYVDALVMLESMLDEGSDALKYWEPFGVKLFDNLELLLMKIINVHGTDLIQLPRLLFPRNDTWIENIFRARGLVVRCLDMMREQHDNESRGENGTASMNKTIEYCMDAAIRDTSEIAYYILHHAVVGEVDPDLVSSLERKNLVPLVNKQITYYKKLTDMVWYVRKLLKNGILSSDTNPEKSSAWNIVHNWTESSIADPIFRLAQLYRDSDIVNVTCPVVAAKNITIHEIVNNACWGPVLEDLLIIESAVREDGLTLETVFYGHPILMNYIYSVKQGLTPLVKPHPT